VIARQRFIEDDLIAGGNDDDTPATLRTMSHASPLPRSLVTLAPRLFLLLLLSTWSASCARTHLFYEARELRHESLKGHQKDELQALLSDRLKDRKVIRVDGDGRKQTVTATRAGLGRLDLAELGALWLATSTGDVGGEADMRVRTSKGSVPVTVTIALDGTIVVHSGGREADPDEGPLLSEDEIRDQYRLKTTLPGKWQANERRALAQSLSLLSPAELDVVRGLVFERRAAPPDRDPDKAAVYALDGCRGTISLYSSGVRSDRFRFVGDPTTPRSAVLHSIVHEMGHAFERDAARDAYCAAARTSGNRRNDLIRQGNQLVAESPVLRAYLDVKAGEPGPTDYGNASPNESFAESFALFHVDPDALQRTLPRVYAWFKNRGHEKAARARPPTS
jgi:hypothetical protein